MGRKKKLLTTPIEYPVWLCISEAAKVAGVKNKTIRRAVKDKGEIKFKVEHNRYLVDFKSLILYLHKTTKLRNKLKEKGIGQYVDKWKS